MDGAILIAILTEGFFRPILDSTWCEGCFIFFLTVRFNHREAFNVETVSDYLVWSPVNVMHISFILFNRHFADIAFPFFPCNGHKHCSKYGEINHTVFSHSFSCLSHESFSSVNFPLYLHHPLRSSFQNLQSLHSSIYTASFSVSFASPRMYFTAFSALDEALTIRRLSFSSAFIQF